MKKLRPRFSFANVISCLALFIALGGSAYAAIHLTKNSVGTRQLKANAVTAAKIRKNAITTKALRNNSVTGSKVNPEGLGTVPSATTAADLSGYSRKGMTRVVATSTSTYEAGLLSAPETPLFAVGPLTIYAQCFSDATPRTYGVISIKTSRNNAIFDADSNDISGDPEFLNANTSPEKREMLEQSAAANSANYYGGEETEFGAMALDGTTIRGNAQIAVKNGSLAGGDGIYGEGNVCLFAGEVTTLNG